MYFWNKDKLNEDLVVGLDQVEDFKYILTITIISILTLEFYRLSESMGTMDIYEYITSGIMLLTGIGGIYICYNINNSAKGINFLSRYLSISFVALMRSIVLVMLPSTIIMSMIIVAMYGGKEVDANLLFMSSLIFSILYLIGYYVLLFKYWKQLMSLEKEKTSIES